MIIWEAFRPRLKNSITAFIMMLPIKWAIPLAKWSQKANRDPVYYKEEVFRR